MRRQAHDDYWRQKGEQDREISITGVLEEGLGDGYPYPAAPQSEVAP